MFVEFLYHLRRGGVDATATEWLTLMDALVRGHARSSLSVFYHLARAIVVKSEAQFDRYDQAFASFFDGVDAHFALDDALLDWLSNPVLPRELTPEERAQLQALDLDTLRRQFEERLKEQKERHDGGSKWVGTGGTSPFGNGGTNPQGIRVGGAGGNRSAVQVATERRYRNLRSDRVLDTRQIGLALRKLRRLARSGAAVELDIDRSIDKSARDGGEIDLVFGPSRRNRLKVLLLMDVGGSMDPHTDLCERLFSAAHASTHFKAFEHFFFHNCPYERLFTDFSQLHGTATDDLLQRLDATWSVVFVGDAYMHPMELSQVGGAIYYGQHNTTTGLDWLRKFRERCPSSVWLNPESVRVWNAPSVRTIRGVFPMFELTLDGLGEAVAVLRGARPNRPSAAEIPQDLPWSA